MIEHSIKAVLGILLLLGAWLLVQAAWRRVFPGLPATEDVMAGRLGCQRCPRVSACDRPHCEQDHHSPQDTQSSKG